jgi:hypothetical protein
MNFGMIITALKDENFGLRTFVGRISGGLDEGVGSYQSLLRL